MRLSAISFHDTRRWDSRRSQPLVSPPPHDSCGCRQTLRRPETRRTGTGRPRPASAVRKTVAAHTLAPLDSAASTDARGRQMSGAQMRRWWRGIYADHRDRTRREESPRRFSRSAALRRSGGRSADSAARGPLQTAAAAQHRHVAGGRHELDSRSSGTADPLVTDVSTASDRETVASRHVNGPGPRTV